MAQWTAHARGRRQGVKRGTQTWRPSPYSDFRRDGGGEQVLLAASIARVRRGRAWWGSRLDHAEAKTLRAHWRCSDASSRNISIEHWAPGDCAELRVADTAARF